MKFSFRLRCLKRKVGKLVALAYVIRPHTRATDNKNKTYKPRYKINFLIYRNLIESFLISTALLNTSISLQQMAMSARNIELPLFIPV